MRFAPRSRAAIAVVALGSFLAACGEGPAAPPTPASIAAVSATTLSGIAGDPIAAAPAVIVKDDAGAPVPGVSVTFAITAGSGTLTGATQTTNAAGTATVGGWTLGPIVGVNTVVATVGSLSATFTVTGIAGPAAIVTRLAGDAQVATVGTAVPTPPSVTVRDAHGNVVAGATVTFTPFTGDGTVSGATQTTDASGVATVGGWTMPVQAGGHALAARVSPTASASFTATAMAGPAASLTKDVGDGQTATVNTTLPMALRAALSDAYGNPVIGVPFTVTYTGPSVPYGGPSGGVGYQSNTDGTGGANVTRWTLSAGAGQNTVTVTVANLPPVTFTATGAADAPATIERTQGDGQTAPRGGSVTIPPSVLLRDRWGNLVTGATVTFTVTGGGGSVTGAQAVTDRYGVATVGGWTLGNTAGTNTLTATTAAPASLSLTFTATAAP